MADITGMCVFVRVDVYKSNHNVTVHIYEYGGSKEIPRQEMKNRLKQSTA